MTSRARSRSPTPDAARPGRVRIALCCSICGNRNYKTTRTKREGNPLILRKFCSNCNQHTIHQEGK